jgi:hypothetical protein
MQIPSFGTPVVSGKEGFLPCLAGEIVVNNRFSKGYLAKYLRP